MNTIKIESAWRKAVAEVEDLKDEYATLLREHTVLQNKYLTLLERLSDDS